MLNVTLAYSGGSNPNLGDSSISNTLTETISNPQEVPALATLTSSFVEYSPPNSNVTRCLVVPVAGTWDAGANDITIAGNGSDTGVNYGSNWGFAYVPIKGASANLYMKCASSTNPPQVNLFWI